MSKTTLQTSSTKRVLLKGNFNGKKDLALLKKISRGVDVKSRKRFFNGIYEEYIHQPTKIVKRKQNSVPYTVLKSEIEKLLDEVSDDFAREKSEIIKS